MFYFFHLRFSWLFKDFLVQIIFNYILLVSNILYILYILDLLILIIHFLLHSRTLTLRLSKRFIKILTLIFHILLFPWFFILRKLLIFIWNLLLLFLFQWIYIFTFKFICLRFILIIIILLYAFQNGIIIIVKIILNFL